ncbi:MAG: hypothetical protein JOY90_19275 [Bradyrhizobium sp.]|uniref:hypothetical protein n=1 Tax=Bradyrhizobium sp. TaxID=376 RepID=UPI001DE91909|nr:hypothetical protein [Bradyrhizobium sp.]MBV9562559.1 hypothetical protein [Bradyrhizobium sp.]
MHAELGGLVDALRDFYAAEAFLFEKDAGERALCHRLAVSLERRFSGWQVDCDYNRLGERAFRLPRGTIVSTDDALAKSVYPDIVVHQREVPKNLLAVEVRKASNHQPLEHDRHKLRGLTDPHLWFAFWIGVLVVLAKKSVSHVEVYLGGVQDQALSEWLASRLKETGLTAP